MNKCIAFLCDNECVKHNLYCQQCLDIKADVKAEDETKSLESGEFSCEDDVYCPYCGYKHDVSNVMYELYEEGEHEFDCFECCKTFTATTIINYSFDTRKGGIDDE